MALPGYKDIVELLKKVYISTHTVGLDKLIAFLESEMKASGNA